MLNLALIELGSFAKNRNMNEYKSMSKDQLRDLITTSNPSPTSRPAFK